MQPCPTLWNSLYIYGIPSAVGLILAGERFIASDFMRVNAADAGCVVRGRCELVCAYTPSDRKIGHTLRSTCVHVRKLREATRMCFCRGLR